MSVTDLHAVVRWAQDRLREAGVASPESDAVALAAHVQAVEAGEIARRMVLRAPLDPGDADRYAALVAERAARVPLQHLTGRAHFRRLTLAVGPGVFIPRPETEVLLDLALAELRDLAAGGSGAPVVVDLCTGSGAIALAVKDEWPGAAVHAVELSAHAHAWATRNVAALGLDVDLVLGDAATAFPELAGGVDVVTCNPPYIPTTMVPVDPEVADHDPAIALYGGSEDGLAIPLRLAARAADLLRAGGLLLMEHAEAQGETLPAALARAGGWAEVVDRADLAGRPRVCVARRATAHAP